MNPPPRIEFYGDKQKASTLRGIALQFYTQCCLQIGDSKTLTRVKRLSGGEIRANVSKNPYGNLIGVVQIFMEIIDNESGLWLTTMDIAEAVDPTYPVPYAPPFQINDDRWLISSPSKRKKTQTYSGGVQRREPEFGVDEGDTGNHNDQRPYTEGGSWRGKINDKEVAVSWSYLNPLELMYDSAATCKAADKYVIYIGGKFGELLQFARIFSGPTVVGAMPIAGVCLIDPSIIGSTADYVIAVLYRTDRRYERIPYMVFYDVSTSGVHNLIFSETRQIYFNTLDSNAFDTLPNAYPANSSPPADVVYIRQFSGFSSDGLSFCAIGFKPTVAGGSRRALGRATVELVNINADYTGYTNSIVWESKEFHAFFPMDFFGITADIDRFTVHFGMMKDYLDAPEITGIDIIEIKDGVATEIITQLGGSAPLDSFSYMLFASARLKIYQYYLSEFVSGSEYRNTLITWVNGTKYEDPIWISLAGSNITNQTSFGVQGQLPYAYTTRWSAIAYTDTLLILPSFDPYVVIGEPSVGKTIMIEYTTKTDLDGIVTVTGYKFSRTRTIDSIFPPELLESAIISPTSLMHLPY